VLRAAYRVPAVDSLITYTSTYCNIFSLMPTMSSLSPHALHRPIIYVTIALTYVSGTSLLVLLDGRHDNVEFQMLARCSSLEASFYRLVFTEVFKRLNKYQQSPRGMVVFERTTTRDFLTPKTASLCSHSSPAGYSAVVSVAKPSATTIRCRWFGRMLCRPSLSRRSPTGPSPGMGYATGTIAPMGTML
jgi:hypothetical protein